MMKLSLVNTQKNSQVMTQTALLTQRLKQQGDSLIFKAPVSFCDRIIALLKSLLDWVLCRSKKVIKVEKPQLPNPRYTSLMTGTLNALKRKWDECKPEKAQFFVLITLGEKKERFELFYDKNQLPKDFNDLKAHLEKVQPKTDDAAAFEISIEVVIKERKGYQNLAIEGWLDEKKSASEWQIGINVYHYLTQEHLQKEWGFVLTKKGWDKFAIKV